MSSESTLQRFIDAQKTDYQIAFREIENGKKQSHWMWYIFPQIKGLGFSSTSKYYAVNDIKEAEAFLLHPLLGSRLISICHVLLNLKINNAYIIFGSPDDMKLRSCMTLFASLPNSNIVFEKVLDKFFNGKKDEATLRIIEEQL